MASASAMAQASGQRPAGTGHPEVEAALGERHRAAVAAEDAGQEGQALAVAGPLGLDVVVVGQGRHAGGLRRARAP